MRSFVKSDLDGSETVYEGTSWCLFYFGFSPDDVVLIRVVYMVTSRQNF